MLHIPYTTVTWRPPSPIVAGNDDADQPVEFDLAPAWGPDLARLKSIEYATIGLVNQLAWTPQMQDAVIKAFETGAPAFLRTIEAIRGLTVDAAMAARAGIITELPKTPGTNAPDPAATIAVTSGAHYARICGVEPLLALSLGIAFEVLKISRASHVDPRFFAPPSGPGGTETSDRTTTTAGNAPRPSRRRATAGSPGPTASSGAGTSRPS